MSATNVVLVGVGGQGIIRLSDLLAEVVFRAGYDVKKSEIHGLSQRGGSVYSFVRWGEKVHTPVIMDGEADFLLSLEELEALRYAHMVKPGGLILVSDFRLLPATVVNKQAKYPEDIDAHLRQYGTVQRIPAAQTALTLGNVRTANIILLGALSSHVPAVDEGLWKNVVAEAFKKKDLEANVRAFEIGRAGAWQEKCEV